MTFVATYSGNPCSIPGCSLGSKRSTLSRDNFVEVSGFVLESGRKRGGCFAASSAAALLSSAIVAVASARILSDVAFAANVAADLKALPQLLQLDAKLLTTALHDKHVFFVAPRRFLLPMAASARGRLAARLHARSACLGRATLALGVESSRRPAVTVAFVGVLEPSHARALAASISST